VLYRQDSKNPRNFVLLLVIANVGRRTVNRAAGTCPHRAPGLILPSTGSDAQSRSGKVQRDLNYLCPIVTIPHAKGGKSSRGRRLVGATV
jgi:hypothetical protein